MIINSEIKGKSKARRGFVKSDAVAVAGAAVIGAIACSESPVLKSDEA